MKDLITLILIVLVGWAGFSLLKGDEYVGFYYPDASNLSNDIQSSYTFDSIEACRSWVGEQVSKHNPTDSDYDYECGKNCDLSQGKPYICEETLE
ncbi:MAG: hypothetical protein WC763_01835 [Candidatus Paceibacterota bacterium]|jgi:hypothetical protein